MYKASQNRLYVLPKKIVKAKKKKKKKEKEKKNTHTDSVHQVRARKVTSTIDLESGNMRLPSTNAGEVHILE